MGNCSNKDKKNKPEKGLKIRGSQMIGSETKLEAKIVLIGNSFVGKSSIALSYKEGRYDEKLKPTVGASYFLKNVGF